MIEVYDRDGTRSFGNFAHFKAARPTLDRLREKGELGTLCPTVRISSFTGHKLSRVYRAEWRNKWCTVPEWEDPARSIPYYPSKKAVPKGKVRKASSRKKRPGNGGDYATLENMTLNSRQRYGLWSREF